MKIGVFGDSFADRTAYYPDRSQDESWIKCIEDAGYDITTYGKTGTSTYYSFEQFQSHYLQFDHIIFCYSSLHRIHHLPEGLEHLSFLQTPNELYETKQCKNLSKQQEIEMVKILAGHILNINIPFDHFVKQKIFNDINTVCRNNNIKIVNVLTFDDNKYTNMNLSDAFGDCLCNLYEISKKELPNMRDIDYRWCHLSKENNQILANTLLQSLMSPTPTVVDLMKNSKFVFSKEIAERYSI